MRWLLLKDLRILGRSPLLVMLLVIYPVAIALLIGSALSRGPEKPKVAFLNLVPPSENTFDLGSEKIDVSKYSKMFFTAVEPIRVQTRAQALEKVRSGEALAALIIPADITDKLASGLEQPTLEVYYNVEDPLKASFVESTLNAQVAKANDALSDVVTKTAVSYLDLLLKGGQLNLLGQELNVMGLQKAKESMEKADKVLAPGSPQHKELKKAIDYAALAIANLGLSDDVLRTIASPLRVKQTVLKGSRTPLDAFAVAVAVTMSLMFVALLLAAGVLALEREENTFARLVRGLVSRLGLLLEKIGLAAVCAFGVALIMLCGTGLFISLDFSRVGLWVVALAAGAVGFGAMGVAIGAITREVRTASLMAFLLSLPIAFLALVPSGAVSSGLYDLIGVICAVFPFKSTLQAIDVALNGGDPGMVTPLLHLVALAVGFTAIARLALRRFE